MPRRDVNRDAAGASPPRAAIVKRAMLRPPPPRLWLAFGLVAVAAGIVVFLTGAWEAGVVAAIGGALAALVATAVAEERAEEAPPADTGPAPIPIAPVLDAIDEPVMLLRDRRVVLANEAALDLLGRHIVGEDARTVIRHPAAAECLAGDVPPARPVELVGLGALDRRWEMRVAPAGDERRVVHLVDHTGNYAAERMRVDFVANASHELRTPLASILGYVETLSDEAGDDPETRARFLRIVFDEARRMDRLVGDLMSLSRIEADKFRLPATQVDLAALTREACDALADAHDGRGRDIVRSIPDDAVTVTGDTGQLSQLLHNLIGNAMKYGRPGTPVEVRIDRDEGAVRLVVADQGEGIAPEHLPRLTERFYRVDAGRSRALGGTGLGLAIVKHIIERHRGRLDIASRVGEGTRVTVIFRAPEGPVIKA